MDYDWITAALKKPRTRKGLAEAMGVSPSAVTLLLKGERRLQANELPKVADYLGVSVPSTLLGGLESVSRAPRSPKSRLKPDIEPATESMRESAVIDPSFVAAMAPQMARMPILAGKTMEWSEMLVSEVPTELVVRPWFLGESKQSYGLIVGTENMSPLIEPDDLVIINEMLDVKRMREALFCTPRENTVFRAILARYIGQSKTHWTIEEASPGTGEEGPRCLAKKEWPDAYPIVAKITRR